MGSFMGRRNQYIQLVKVLYCKLLTKGKQLPAFPLEVERGFKLGSQRWETRVLPLCHRGLSHRVLSRWGSIVALKDRLLKVKLDTWQRFVYYNVEIKSEVEYFMTSIKGRYFRQIMDERGGHKVRA